MTFGELSPGDCFCFGEQHVFLKINRRSCDSHNAIVLASSFYSDSVIFEDFEYVTPVNYAIVVRTNDECIFYAPNGLILSRVPL